MLHNQEADITAERAQSSAINIRKLTETFHGGKDAWERKQFLFSLLENEPVFNRRDRFFLGRTERFQRALAMSKRYVEIRAKHKLSAPDTILLKAFIDDYLPISLHETMFLPVLESQASDAQLTKWHQDALNYRIIGCYAQTELGHGSNLSGLETTASLDKVTDEWVIHSPHATSGKFWIGTLGKLANHAIVQAKLIIDGQDYGTHPFLVPLRSLEDHRPFPGVEILDIGPKVGGNSMDNGYAMFRNYRIPRENMLMRHSQVTRDGKYYKPMHDKLVYGGMTVVRVNLVESAANALSRAATIAVRYSAVRRQGGGTPEQQILDYPTVQYRLFPLLAHAYAISFTGVWMRQMHNNLLERVKRGDTSTLADVHAYSSGLKSYSTTVVADGIEDSRRCIGGHGYSMFSGIPDYYQTYISSNTYEGENWLLTQQTGRYLVKLLTETLRDPTSTGHLSPTTIYLHSLTKRELFIAQRCAARTVHDLLDPEIQLLILSHRAGSLVSELSEQWAKNPGASWSLLNIDSARVSRAHCQYLISLNFINFIRSDQAQHDLNSATRALLKNLCDLHSLCVIEQNLGEILESGYLDSAQAHLVRQGLQQLLKSLRPHAVALTDGFGWPDNFLNSALGSYDGRAYERLVEWLKEEPLNSEVGMDENGVVKGYKEFIKPIVSGECGKWAEDGRPKL